MNSSEVVKTHVTYVEKATIHHMGEVTPVYVCIGDHSVFLVKPNLKCLLHDGAEIYYAHIVLRSGLQHGLNWAIIELPSCSIRSRFKLW